MLDDSAITKAHQGYLYPAMGDPVGEEVRLLHDTKDISLKDTSFTQPLGGAVHRLAAGG